MNLRQSSTRPSAMAVPLKSVSATSVSWPAAACCVSGAIDAGSTNLGVLDADGVPRPSDNVYQNSYAYVAYMVEQCTQHALPITFAIFEPTFLHTVCVYHRACKLPPGSWLKFYFAGYGGYAGTGTRWHEAGAIRPPADGQSPRRLPRNNAGLRYTVGRERDGGRRLHVWHSQVSASSVVATFMSAWRRTRAPASPPTPNSSPRWLRSPALSGVNRSTTASVQTGCTSPEVNG